MQMNQGRRDDDTKELLLFSAILQLLGISHRQTVVWLGLLLYMREGASEQAATV